MKPNTLKPPFTRALTVEELAALPDSEVDLSDAPEASDAWFANARVDYPTDNKQQLTMRFDADVIDFFKAQGRGYQTRMNAVLRTYVDARRK